MKSRGCGRWGRKGGAESLEDADTGLECPNLAFLLDQNFKGGRIRRRQDYLEPKRFSVLDSVALCYNPGALHSFFLCLHSVPHK